MNIHFKKKDSNLDCVFYSLTFMISILIIIRIFTYCGYGFDYTDESFYLIWMSNPFIYKSSLSQFGFIYHPIYKLLNGDIAQLRQFNVLIIFVLSSVLNYLVLDEIYKDKMKLMINLFYSLAIASFSISYLILGVSTPSYNSLNFQGILLASIGLLLTCNDQKQHVFGWVLIGIGGFITFMAKPSSALFLGSLVVVFNFRAIRLPYREIAISLFTFLVLLLFSGIIIDGSIMNFFYRYQNGFLDMKVLLENNFGFSVFRYDSLHLNKNITFIFMLLFAYTFASINLLSSENKNYNNYGKLLISALVFINFLAAFGYIDNSFILAPFKKILSFNGALINTLLIFVFPLSILIYFFSNMFCDFKLSKKHKFLALFFSFLPFVYAFGTGINYWWQACSVPVFWLVSGLIFFSFYIKKHNNNDFLVIPLILSSQLMTLIQVNYSINHPYRQPQSLALNTEKVSIRSSNLLLSSQSALNIRKWKKLAKN